MSTNDEIEDALTRHQILVQRYAKGREQAYADYIDTLIDQTRARLTFDITPESRVRTERLMMDLKALAEQLTGELTEETMDEMRRLMTQEAQFNYEILDTRVVADLTLPNANQIEAALSTNIMQLEPTKGYTIRSALAEFGSRKAGEIVRAIRDGSVLGDTTQAIIQTIMDLAPMQRRQASTLARTITNHVATQARDLTMGENRDILEGYKWVATLDGRTSLICASRDGKIYPIADDSPKPPAHFNCRSTITFAVKPEFDLGADLPGTRASVDGPVDRNLTFGDWLRRQSPEFQDEVLGKQRGRLFREQNIPIDRFVDDQGRVLSLDQLRRMDEDFNGIAPPPDLVPEPVQPRLDFEDVRDPRSVFEVGELEDVFDEYASPLVKDVARKLNKPKTITSRLGDQKAFYRRGEQTLQQAKKKYWQETFIHEYGHHLDYEIRMAETGERTLQAWSETSDEFMAAWTADRKALGLAGKNQKPTMDRLSEIMYEWEEVRSKKTGNIIGRRKRELNSLVPKLSDIVDSMVSGKFWKMGHWGHGPSYYKNAGMKQKETFANLCAIHNDKQAMDKAREWFPNLMRVFEEKMQSIVDQG